MNYDRYERIKTIRRDRILTISLNRPAVLNAIDGRMHDELTTIFSDAQADGDTDIVVLTGEGRAFSAGGDVSFLAEIADDAASIIPAAKKIIFSLLDLEKPIIARIQGPCVGLGATMALLCDVIYATETATIGDPHVRMGIVAGDGGAVIWPQLIGYARAKQYLMTGDLLTGREAARIGLVNAAVPDGELDKEVYAMADRLAKGPINAVRWTKASINIGLKQLAHSIMDTCLAYEFLSFKSNDYREAIAAFKQKRVPVFAGK